MRWAYDCVTTTKTFGQIVDFQSETASSKPLSGGYGACGKLFGYTSLSQSTFLSSFPSVSRFNYASGAYLNYDAHPGYDYPFAFGTALHPAISGCVTYNLGAAGASASGYHILAIIPQSVDPAGGCEHVTGGRIKYPMSETGYVVFYLHLSSYPGKNGTMRQCLTQPAAKALSCSSEVPCPQCPAEGTWVSSVSSPVIGYVGNFDSTFWGGPSGKVQSHLHLEVGWDPSPGPGPLARPIPLDPYGWWSAMPDPYTVLPSGRVNTWLWK